MSNFIHKVNYYETDRMGITHHSNYVRWMEEARMDYLNRIGYGLKKLESDGVTSPVVSIECQYKQPTTFDDEIEVALTVKEYNGIKLTFSYTMTNLENGAVVLTAKSTHCFLNSNGKPIAVKKYFPEFDAILKQETAQIQ